MLESCHEGLISGLKTVAVLLLAIGCVAVYAGDGNSKVAHLIPQEELLNFLADKSSLTLIDARTPEEFAKAHVNGAVNIPVGTENEHLDALPAQKDDPILVYCRSGRRASTLRLSLLVMGYTNVRVLPSEQLLVGDDYIAFNCGVSGSKKGGIVQ